MNEAKEKNPSVDFFFQFICEKLKFYQHRKKDSSNGKNAACIVFHVDGEER